MDSDHRAAAREAELRALRAEKEALSQQNRRTWSLLEERTNEAHQLSVRACLARAAMRVMKLPCNREMCSHALWLLQVTLRW